MLSVRGKSCGWQAASLLVLLFLAAEDQFQVGR